MTLPVGSSLPQVQLWTEKRRESRSAGWSLQTRLLSQSDPCTQTFAVTRLRYTSYWFNVHPFTDDFSREQNRYFRIMMTVTELMLWNRLDHLFLIPLIFLLHSGFCSYALLLTSGPLITINHLSREKNKIIKTPAVWARCQFHFLSSFHPTGFRSSPHITKTEWRGGLVVGTSPKLALGSWRKRRRRTKGGGNDNKEEAHRHKAKKKILSFFFVDWWRGNFIRRSNSRELTATIMMQLSRNPKPTKGRALCSKTGGRTTNRNTLH